MRFIVPACGILFVLLAAYTAVAEMKRALTASGGDLQSLRPYGTAWTVAFAASCAATVLLKSAAAYLAMGGLVLIAWIAIPTALVLAKKMRTEGPMGIGKTRRK